ncbi:chemotaxis protein CheW [Hyphomonadaceae bacterium BL14]|nr:chemotaxis protein CheW [Hyphomonadaceae bacterium BL14]
MDELIGEFLAETAESLDVIDSELVKFEANPGDRATLDNIFRLLHTIKGTCGFLALTRLEAVAHAGETLLGRFRDGTLVADSTAVTLVLQSLDRIKMILGGLEADGAEPDGDDSDLIAQLEAMAEGRSTAAAAPKPAPAPAPTPAPEPEPEPVAVETVSAGPDAAPDPDSPFDSDLGRALRPGEVSLADLEAAFMSTPGPEEDEPDAPGAVQAAHLDRDEEMDVTPSAGPVSANDTGAASGGARSSATIRVSVDVLENLMTTVSELVLARNQMQQLVMDSEDSELKGPLQRLTSVTGELQDGVMKTRMQPVGDAWRKLPRIVRDACQDLGKKIRLIQEGEDTELDRQVLELIKDPLTHMIRNSCDHGIESPAARAAAGKPETGTIRLSAYHEGGAIIMKISDDGAGLNAGRIREKVLEKGLATPEELAGMSEAQIQRFIFAPGFSTAAAVTSLSGRGVGMDVVRTNIEQIGGAIDLASTPGGGTAFTIKIPLTLAIISALIVKAGGARFAAPQLSVRELVRVGPGSAVKVETLNGAHLIRLRDRLLPVVALSGVLDPSATGTETPAGYVIVLEASGRRIGLVVDDVVDTVEIVVKPLSGPLRQLNMFSGATILGDGSVIMILDPNGLAQETALEGEDQDQGTETADGAGDQAALRQRLLLVRAGGTEPKAVPVSLITRLEDIDASAIEIVDGRHVVQYRGRLLPLAHAAGPDAFRTEGRQPVLVFAEDDRSAGVAVDAIIDVVEEALELELGSDRPGVIGSAILKGKATEMLDIAWFMERAWDGAPQRSAATRAARPAVLLVEADAFSRRMLAPLLAAAGYDVTVAGSLHEARDAAQMGARYDVLVGDPAALARLAEESLFADVPRLGVGNSHSGILEGFVAIMRPSDRGGLIAALDQAARAA